MKTWGIIENDKELKAASDRFEKIRTVKKGQPEYKEKMLLLLLIKKYEEQKSILPDVDPIEFIKIRMEEMPVISVNDNINMTKEGRQSAYYARYCTVSMNNVWLEGSDYFYDREKNRNGQEWID